MRNNWYHQWGKRLLDICLTIPALILFLPLLGLILILLRIKHGCPIIFYQKRPGLQGKSFTIYKFRTMNDAWDNEGNLLPDKERLTTLGRFLRSTSLDELPELFNVLKGEMSLIGPRPLLMEYLDRYTPEHARRHSIKPGITGWAQVNGRINISFSKRFEYDLWYIDNYNFRLDLKILVLTIFRVLLKEGAKPVLEVCEVDDIGLSVDQ